MSDAALADPIATPTAPSVPPPERAAFTGTGGEYFRIWIVNLALSIATLGIYSAWAKVRREQYFHANTRLAGASFGYHARPIAILLGRAIAIGAFLALQIAGSWSAALNAALLAALFVAMPWVIVRSLRFRLANTSHRGIRFRFHGTKRGAAGAYLGLPLLLVPTFGLGFPFVLQRQALYRTSNAAFGTTRFRFDATPGAYYGALVAPALLFAAVLGVGLFFVGAGTAGAAAEAPDGAPPVPPLAVIGAIGAYVAALLVAAPLAQVRLENLQWNALAIGPHRFVSDQRFGSYLALVLVNAAATILTLGLFRPFAAVRVARYRAEHLTLVAGTSLDHFLADAADAGSATGEEVSELFDFDIGF